MHGLEHPDTYKNIYSSVKPEAKQMSINTKIWEKFNQKQTQWEKKKKKENKLKMSPSWDKISL